MDRAREWATRLLHEAKLHEENCFITLTYSDENLPWDGSVSKRHLQLFMKRLRKELHPVKIRFFACGEYGNDNGRPHYHALIFGFDFSDDRRPWGRSPGGYVRYRSARLERVWPLGHCEIGSVTHSSAGYVARYCLKGLNGTTARSLRLVSPDGVVTEFAPEFLLMSRRPGIGSGWFDRYHGDAFPSDFVIVDGRKVSVPRYYSKKLAEVEALRIKARRKSRARKRAFDNTPERLAVRHEVTLLKIRALKRNL